MRNCLPLVALVAGCEGLTPAPPPSVLPSLQGVLIVTESDRASPSVIDRIGESSPECVADAYGGIELVADVAPNPGKETVLASFSQGVVVLAADGHRIASTPGFDCTGSQDDLVAVEIVRTSLDTPVIAVAANQGGRRESSAWLELLAVGKSDHLDRLFVGEIERYDELGTHTGGVTIVPGGLVYRHPIDGVSLWRYEVPTHRYVKWRSIERPKSRDRRSPAID